MIGFVAYAVAADTSRSLDIELVRPQAVDGAIVGVDGLGDGDRGEMHGGVFFSYTHDPLLLIGDESTVRGVERNRMTMDVAGAWQATKGFGLRVGVPIISDWGTQVDALAAEGVGVGDPWLGATLAAPRFGPVRLGAAADVALPVGTRDAWRGEASPRLVPTLLADLRLGRLSVDTDAALVLRDAVDTGVGLHVGTELRLNGGVGWDVWKERARVTLAAVSRVGLSSEGEAANALEVVGGIQAHTGIVQVDGWVGRGLNIGYGASDYRVGLGATVHVRRKPPEVAPEPVARLEPVEPEDMEDFVDPPPPPEPPPPVVALAQVVEDEIVIRDPIQFELGTANILPESLPTLHEVAAILRDHPDLLQVVIEGHASEEGSFQYNYDLSMSRANAVFKELVLAGVHPDRLSCRSMGEVKPVNGPAGEDLVKSRRVVFLITRRLFRSETPPTYDREIRVPWTGDALTIPEGPPVVMAPPAAPPPAPTRPAEIPSRADFEEEDEAPEEDP